MKSVFLSYSHEDKEFARQLASDLTSSGISVGIDQHVVMPGDSIIYTITKAITESDYIVVVLSKSSVNSHWVQREIRAAFIKAPYNAGRVLIPVVIDQVKLPSFLQGIRYVDFAESYQSGFNDILQFLQSFPTGRKPNVAQTINPNELAKDIAKELSKIFDTVSQT